MFDFLTKLFDTADFPPRWYCGDWSDGHGWLHIISDVATWGAYMAIPTVLAFFALKRRDVPFHWIFLLFGAFIFACGNVHLVEAIIFWQPVYRLSGVLKLGTAIVSWLTVFALIRITPAALALPGLAAANARLEEEVHERGLIEASLRASEQQFRSLADAMPQIVFAAPPDGNTDYYNRRWYEYTGMKRGRERDGAWQSMVHPDDVQAAEEAWRRSIETGETYQIQYRLREHATGAYHWHLALALPTRDDSGRIMRWYGSCTDIQRQKQVEEELERAVQVAASANAAKSEFLANMSHEIRTPMAAILGYADVLLGRLQDPDDREAVQTIRRNGDHLLQVINDILDLSRIEAGKLELNVEEVSPVQLVEDVRSLMNVRAQEKELELRVEFEGRLPAVIRTDETRVRQILINLLGNAIKFTPSGSVTVRTRMLQASNPPMLEFEVSDTGIGMTSSQIAQLFQPFSQGDASVTRQFGGSGLGLAITKRLLGVLQGTITLRSAPGEGSTFRVSIPTGTVDGVATLEPVLPPAAEDDASPPTEEPRVSGRVLVVDDRRDIRFLAQHFLTEAGAETASAEDGQSGADMALAAEAEGEPFAVVLMDMQMPKMDGYSASRLLRRKGYRRPIIALTANAMKGDRDKCILAGCNDYTTKPLDREHLIRLIAHYSRTAHVEEFEEERQRRVRDLERPTQT